jgi:hypothetical protein
MYLSSRRGVKRAGIVGAGGPPALSRLVAENSIVVDDARAFPDQALALQIRRLAGFVRVTASPGVGSWGRIGRLGRSPESPGPDQNP